jgi:predicted  nucleic acid-binding Zn-ribbon protein
MDKILEILKNRHKQADNLMAFTKEIEKAIDANDVEALGAILSMRQTSMDHIDAFNLEIRDTLDSLNEADKEKARQILDMEREQAAFENPLESNIYETNKATISLVQKVISLDKEINEKLRKGG